MRCKHSGPKETKGSLEFMVKEQGKYSHLVDDAGNWTTQQDVRYVHVMDQRGIDYKDMEKFGDVRNEWLTPNKSFGPELGFGHVMGHFHDEPVPWYAGRQYDADTAQTPSL